MIKHKSVFKLDSLIVSHTKVSKLYFYKCGHFHLFLSLSTVLIQQFHSYTKIFTLIPLISTPYSPYSHPYSSQSLHFHPDSLHSHHSHPDLSDSHPDSSYSHHSHPGSRQSHHSSHSIPWFSIPAFTDSRFPTKRLNLRLIE